jgi:GNAT superfamily N-acetyltransferase
MTFREADKKDIQQLQVIRNQVNENKLSNPDIVADEDYQVFFEYAGKGWVCENGDRIVGFSVVDLHGHNIWALFVHPDYEGQGIGRRLYDIMLDWYFGITKQPVWLGTEPNTRAESFYRKSGWKEIGTHGKGEMKFEMTYADWFQRMF